MSNGTSLTKSESEVLEVREFTCVSCRHKTEILIFKRLKISSIDCTKCRNYFWWDSVNQTLTDRTGAMLSRDNYRLVELFNS